MAFLIPIIILKCLGLGPRALETPQELEEFTKKIDKVETTGLQQEINAALQTLTRVHSVLALLQAAMNPPDDTANARPGVTGNIVAAYADAEEQDFKEAIEAIKVDDPAIDPSKGGNLDVTVIQKVKLPSMAKSAPVLELFLKRFEANGSAANLKPADCLKVCRHSVSDAQGVNPQASLYMAKASGLLTLLWGPNVERDLGEVRNWLTQIKKAPGTAEWLTEDWLTEQLELGQIRNAIQQIYQNADQPAMLALSRIAILLSTSRDDIFPQIYGRLMDKQNGMEKTIDDFTQQTSATAAQGEAWRYLLAATNGCIAWQILQQARLAVTEAHLVCGME